MGNQRLAEYQLREPNQTIINGFSADAANSADMAVSPRVTLGLQGECWGVEARYWRMDDPVNSTDINPLNYGTGAIADAGFRAEMFDLEITRRFCIGDTQMQFAAGACYGQLDQSSYLSANELYGGGLYSGSVLSFRNFSGAGLTSALAGVRPIGCCDSGLKLFYSARASILWDNCTTAGVDTWASYGTTGASAQATTPASPASRPACLSVRSRSDCSGTSPEVHPRQRLRAGGLRVSVLGHQRLRRRTPHGPVQALHAASKATPSGPTAVNPTSTWWASALEPDLPGNPGPDVIY